MQNITKFIVKTTAYLKHTSSALSSPEDSVEHLKKKSLKRSTKMLIEENMQLCRPDTVDTNRKETTNKAEEPATIPAENGNMNTEPQQVIGPLIKENQLIEDTQIWKWQLRHRKQKSHQKLAK